MGTKRNPGKYDCYDRAQPDEPMFILLGRDRMAGQLVSMWVTGAELRLSTMIEEAKTKGATQADIETNEGFLWEYEKIQEAKRCATAMQEHCAALGKVPMRWNAKPPVLNVTCDVTKEEVGVCLGGLSKFDHTDAKSIIERMARALRILP
jgi:hypothetical protein